jgi:hypothetical protein
MEILMADLMDPAVFDLDNFSVHHFSTYRQSSPAGPGPTGEET